jgi:hypothetical protein
MTEVRVAGYPTPNVLRVAVIGAKAALILMLVSVLIDPDGSHLRGKAAEVRAVVYPLLAFTVPVIWSVWWKERATFPWLADFLVTITCFTDILGNRMDFYGTIVWFDDWMHFMNTGFLAAAVMLLTMSRTSSRTRVIERALAFGATAAIAWELAEYAAFIHGSSERVHAYTDTLGDLGLGTLGALVAAVTIHALWQHGQLITAAPQLDSARVSDSGPFAKLEK